MKDQDSFARTQYVGMYFKVLPVSLFFGIMALFAYGWLAFILIMLGGLLLPFPAMYATGRIADFFVFIYSGGSGRNTLQDQLAGEVEKIRILKREHKFREALEQAEVVLARDPEHPEALLLKAQILFEGFAQYSAANACLSKIIDRDPAPDDKFLLWASALREEILERIRERAEQQG
ncbi:MAG: hypothetical protein QTN59_13990 [Candidatus Electrothrix communis]|nr:MAG: hypothetical protein QTN59_13990 [Candidatus Electrothrix communis]